MDVFIKQTQERRINGKYCLTCKLGEGGFGAVYSGQWIAPCARLFQCSDLHKVEISKPVKKSR